MRLPFPPAASITVAVLAVACDQGVNLSADVDPADADPATAHPEAPPGIAWFGGGLDAAFDAADAADEPVLLYWGAEWCPYCADLEAHVFSREDVKQKLELFVPVYLDGDDPGAQRAADVFGVAGYPTVLALAPDRTELARIAGGMDLTQYAEMLDLVLGDLRPIDDIIGASETGPLSADDCRRLAYNGWPLADAASERTASLAATLADAAERCAGAGRIARARLIVYAMSFAVAEDGDEALPLVEELVGEMRGIVADRKLAGAIADALRELDERYFAAARAHDPDGVRMLLDDWIAIMDAAATDPRYGHGDQLAAVRSKVEAVASLDPNGIPQQMTDDARRRIDEALAEVGRSAARAGTANAAINLLVAIGDLDRARAIAEEGLEISSTPYYHMADLAWIDEMLGRYDDAVAWLEKAYHASNGPATRFQWGTNYVRGLLRMRPEDDAAIRTAGLAVLSELDGSDRIYRRTRGRLETLDSSLREWNADGRHDDVIAALRGRMSEICTGISAADEPDAHAACTAFLG
jgi:thioredoxin-like negative regulator of GroEL